MVRWLGARLIGVGARPDAVGPLGIRTTKAVLPCETDGERFDVPRCVVRHHPVRSLSATVKRAHSYFAPDSQNRAH